MDILVHFLNGTDEAINNHYAQKEYRDDIIVEIENLFYEVYFYVDGTLIYEFTDAGFFSLPGLIILDEISYDKIIHCLKELVNYKYFEHFKGSPAFPIKKRFIDKWYLNELSQPGLKDLATIKLE